MPRRPRLRATASPPWARRSPTRLRVTAGTSGSTVSFQRFSVIIAARRVAVLSRGVDLVPKKKHDFDDGCHCGQGTRSERLTGQTTENYLARLGVPALTARTSAFDPGYDAVTVAAHL